MIRLIALSFLFLFSFAVAQNYVATGDTKIIRINSYNQFGDGDVTVDVETPIPQCPHGYWLTTTDQGFNANLSLILAAYQAGNTVKVWGLPDQLWPGSSGTVCKLYSVLLD